MLFIIYHAAAHNMSRLWKINQQGIKNNTIGTTVVAKLSNEFKYQFVFISTDKTTNPTNMMGASKETKYFYNHIVIPRILLQSSY